MPAGAAGTPGRRPTGLTRLGRLPQSKIQGILLDLLHSDTGAALQVVQRLVGQLTVFAEAAGAEIHIPILRHVGIALLNQGGHDVDDHIHILGRLGMGSSRTHAKALGIRPEFLDVFLRNLLVGDPFLIGPADDLVVDVGEILHEIYRVPPPLQIPAQHVKNAQRAGVADVDEIVHRGAAGVQPDLSRFQGNQFFFLSGQRIVYTHSFILLCFYRIWASSSWAMRSSSRRISWATGSGT